MKIKAMVLMVALGGLVACDQGPTGPTTDDFDNERQALMSNLSANKSAPKPAAAPAPDSKAMTVGALISQYSYDRNGTRDPFRSFEWDEKARNALMGADRGPLEQYDINQMALQAVVWNSGVARALVKDPAGNSYIVGTGTRMGKNEGRITRINDNLVTVKETYVDFLGQETTKDIEMRIRRSEGG